MSDGTKRLDWENFEETTPISQPTIEENPLNPSNLANWEQFTETPMEVYTGAARDRSSRYDIGIPYSQAISPMGFEQHRYEEQTGVNRFGSMLNQAVVGEVAGGIVEGVGYLFDLGDVYRALRYGETEVGNGLSEIGKSIKEGAREATPIYTDPFSEGEFRPDQWSWWMSNAPSVASTLSLMIPSGLAVKGLGTLARAAKIGGGLSKTAKVTARGVTQAVISRQMESMMEASGVYDDSYQYLKSKDVSEEEARHLAGQAAASTYKANWAMLAQDIFQYTTLIKPFGKATGDLTMKTARRLGMDVSPVILNKFKAVGTDMVGEAAEEGYQFIAGERAREMAEVRAGLRTKRSLGEAMGDYMGQGDFWTSAFFGALGAGFMQTAGKGLNAARERIRGLEDPDTKRIRDIDSWQGSIKGLADLNTTGEAMGTPDFNTKNRQVAEFGTRLSQNGNLDWFLKVADNFGSLTQEEQENFGFTPEELEAAKKQFPNLTKDLQRIGEIYEDLLNNSEAPSQVIPLATEEQYLADKLLEEHNRASSEYIGKSELISGTAAVDMPASAKNLVIKSKLELNNLKKVRKDLSEQPNTSQETLNDLDTRIKELQDEINESKKTLRPKAKEAFNKFNHRTTSYREAASAFRKKEFLKAERQQALDQVDYYTDPKNQIEILKAIEKVQAENLKQAQQEATSAQEVSEQQREVQAAEDQGAMPSGTSAEAFTNFVEQAEQQQEGTPKYESLIGALADKYDNKPQLLNQDIEKILGAFQTDEFWDKFNPEDVSSVNSLVKNIEFNLKNNRSLDNFKASMIATFENKRFPAAQQLQKEILDIINEGAEVEEVKTAAKKTEDSIDDPNNNNIDSRKDVEIHKISDEEGEIRYKIKDTTKGNNFHAVNKVGESGPKELGIDQTALNNGEVKVGDTVEFRVDKKKEGKKGTIEYNLKSKKDQRSIDMIVRKGDKVIVIGKVPTSKYEKNPEVAAMIDNIRDVVDSQLKKNYNKEKDFAYADVTSQVSGAFYTFTRTDNYGTPNQKIKKADQEIEAVSDIGGWTGDYVTVKNGHYHLSGQTRMTIEINDEFTNTDNGGLIIPVPHPIMEGQVLYLRAFSRTIKQYAESNAENATVRGDTLINNLKDLFGTYLTARTEEAKNIIKGVIVRDFEIKSDTLILRKRNGDVFAELPIDNTIYENPEFTDWLWDSKLNINKNRLNTPSENQNIGYGNRLAPYNKMIGDFITLSIEDGNYMTDVQMLVSNIDTTAKPKKKQKVAEETVLENTVPAEEVTEPDTKKDMAGNISKKEKAQTPALITKDKYTKEEIILKNGKLTILNLDEVYLQTIETNDGSKIERTVDKKTGKTIGIPKITLVMDGSDMQNLFGKKPGLDLSLTEKQISDFIKKQLKTPLSEKPQPKEAPKKSKPKGFKKVGNLTTDKKQVKDVVKKASDKNRPTRHRKQDSLQYPKWNKKEALAWMYKNFPEVDINILENLEEVVANGKEYWGVFHNAAIYIAENAATGTLYHEAFHAMFWLFNDSTQREALFNEAAKRYNIPREQITNLEEAMADEFMEYVQTEIVDKSWTTAIANFFKKIWQTIKSLRKNPIYSIDEMFFRGNKGFYAKPTIPSGNFGTNITRYRPAWTYRQEKDAVEAINGHLLTSVIPSYRENNKGYENLSDVEIINEVGLKQLYKDVIDFLGTVAQSEGMPQENVDNIWEAINNLYDFETDTFKQLLTSLVRGLDYNNGVKINQNTLEALTTEEYDAEDATEDDLKEHDEKAQERFESISESATERSTKDNALAEVKRFLRYMDSGMNNIFGFPALVDYNETYDTLLKNLAGSTHVNDMVEYLEDHVEITNPEYQQILDEFESNPQFKTQFFNAFNKNHTKYNMVSFINGNFAVYQANRKGLATRFINEWAENILNNKNVITISAKGEKTVNLKVKDIVADIRAEIEKTIDGWNKDVGLEYYQDLSDAIEKLGITIGPEVLHYIGSYRDKGKENLNKFFNKGRGNFNFILEKFNKLQNPFDAEGGLEAGETDAIRNAANMTAKAHPELYESSFRNLAGKTVYSHLEQNFLTKLVHRLRNPERRKVMLSEKESPFYKDQLFYVLDEDGKKVLSNRILVDLKGNKETFDIMVTEGLTDDQGNRIHYSNLDAVGQKLYTIHNYFNNGTKNEAWYRGPVLSDAPNGIVFRHRKETDKDQILEALASLANQEYNRIKSIRSQLKKNRNKPHLLIENYHTDDNADIKTGYHIIQGMRGKTADISTPEKKDKVKNQIDSWLKNKTRDYWNSLIESEVVIINEDKTVSKDSRLDKRILDKYKTEKELMEFIQEFYLNDFLSRAEFNLLTVGDPAFYSSREGNNKTVDYIKRAKEIYSPKSLLDVTGEYTDPETGEVIRVGVDYKTVYVTDNKIESPSYKELTKTVNNLLKKGIISKETRDNIVKNYKSVNQTDAQAYITLPFYRRTMIGAGKWTNAHQAAYKRLIKAEGTGADIALVMQPLKPFMYGQSHSDIHNRLVPIQNKNSEFLLLPQLIKNNPDSKLQNLYDFMMGAKIDVLNFESAVKAGASKVIDGKLFDNREALDTFIKEQYEPYSTDWNHTLAMEDRGIQQEVPEHYVDADNLYGTQIRKLIMSDLFEGTSYLGMKASKLRALYEDLLLADLMESFEELNADITKNKDRKAGERPVINYKYVYGILLDEARKRGKGEEFEKAIQYDANKDKLVLPLFNPVTARSAQNLITSIFKTRITKQKIDGGAFVQVSGFGLSEELKLVFNEQDGLEYAEVMLPAWSKKFFKDFLKSDGSIDFESIKARNPELLDMVGYRIPTEDKYSMLPLRVKGFLPFNSGGGIMLPADITQIAGSDFDVDKMYIMMKSFKRKARYNLDALSEKISTELKEKVTPGKLGQVLKDANSGVEMSKEDLKIYNVINLMPEEEQDSYKDVTYETYEYDDSRGAANQEGTLEERKKKRNNKKLDIITAVLRNPHTFESIFNGGTFAPLQDIADLTARKTGKAARELDPTSINSMDEMHKDNMTGKSMIGIAANENAFHAIAQNTNLRLKGAINFDEDSHKSLHEKTAKTYVYINKETGQVKVIKNPNQRISKNKAYYLAAIVDNAKDPLAAFINYNDYTSGVVGLLLQVGLDPATITWFLKQPVIEDITNKFYASGKDWAKESAIINEYKKKFGIKKDPKSAPNLNTTDLFDKLNVKPEDASQVDVLKAFLVYKRMAKDWTSLVLASRADTKGFGPTLADSEMIEESIKNVSRDKFLISGVQDLFDLESKNTRVVAGFTEYGINKPQEIVNQMFPYSEGFYKNVKTIINNNLKNRDLSARERNNINDQITAYMLSKYDLFNPNDRDYYLNKFPKEFLEITEKDSIFANNYLIRRLQYRSKTSDPRIPIERIEFANTGSLTNEQKNDIQQAWLDLYSKEEYRDIAQKLLIYTYFTTGMSFGINGFSHLASVDFLSDNGVKDSHDQSIATFLHDIVEFGNEVDPSDTQAFIDQFYKNNYSNKAFVPEVTKDNITKQLKNDKGQPIGFLVEPDVKDDSFIIDEDNYTPYISYKQKDTVYLYKLINDPSVEGMGVYIQTNKLGYSFNIYEYLRNATGLRSVLSMNQIDVYTIEDVVNLDKDIEVSGKTDFVEPKTDNVKITKKDFKINSASANATEEYPVDFDYQGTNYKISKKSDGSFVNNKTGVKLEKNSPLVKLFENAVAIIQETTCGG